MIIQITISDSDEVAMLTTVAGTNNMAIDVYATSLIRSFLQTRIKEFYIGEINKLPLADIKAAYDLKKAKP